VNTAALGAAVDKGLEQERLATSLALDIQAAVRQFLACYAAAVGLADKLHEFAPLGERPPTGRATASTISHNKKPPFLVVTLIISRELKKAILACSSSGRGPLVLILFVPLSFFHKKVDF